MRQIFRPRIIAMAIIVSMGGFIFGKSLHMQCDHGEYSNRDRI
jgi:hypothetical protein